MAHGPEVLGFSSAPMVEAYLPASDGGCRDRGLPRLQCLLAGPLLGCSVDFISPLSIPSDPCTKIQQQYYGPILPKLPSTFQGSHPITFLSIVNEGCPMYIPVTVAA